MLLGFMLEMFASLPARFDALKARTGSVGELQFHPPEIRRTRTAPAHIDPWRGRLLIREVDDENAWAFGGAAGHAGLFGTAAAVGDQARHLLQVLAGRAGAFSRLTLELFIARRLEIPGSSSGARVGHDAAHVVVRNGHVDRAFGHTGFTGTSLWLDPDRRVYVVLLTNRVYPDRQNQAITQGRPAVHDAVMSEM